jgi:hypothetical protein
LTKPFFFQFFVIQKLAKSSKSLAKLVEFTLENQIVPNFSQFPNFFGQKRNAACEVWSLVNRQIFFSLANFHCLSEKIKNAKNGYF